MSDLSHLVGIGDTELSKALIRGLPPKLIWYVVSFNPTTLTETIQRILLGEAAFSYNNNDQVNSIIDNGITTAMQKMDERLDKLEDILKSCQLSITDDPVETNQPLPAQSDIIFNKYGMNVHEWSVMFSVT